MSVKKIYISILSLLLIICIVGCGKNTETQTNKIVSVSSVDELIREVGNNRVIKLNTGAYNLSEASTYGKETGNEHCYWRELWNNDYELVIDGVENLSIDGSNSSIIAVPRSAAVITFSNCTMINIQNTVMGHKISADACEGGVMKLDSCNDISVTSCSLYGCGTIGITAGGSDNIHISDCEIYSCSSTAFDISYVKGTSITNCDIHNLGGIDASDKAYAVFNLNESKDIVVQSCRVHDCSSQLFIIGNNIENAVFDGINVYSNHFSSVFDVNSQVSFTNPSFSSNVIDRWFSELSSGKICINGNEYTDERLTDLYSSELSSYGVGTIDIQPKNLDYSGCREVHVNTADEFLDAIASNTVIYIDSNLIELTEAASYSKLDKTDSGYEDPSNFIFSEKKYAWLERYDGYALAIGCIENFHIVGPGKIVTKITYADVLSFYNCNGISLENTTLGHNAEPGACVGGVLNFSLCDNVIIEKCDLFGCGILGISAANSNNLYVQNTLIHDCSYGGVVFSECQDVAFIESKIENCPFPNFDIQSCINFSVNGKVMASNCSF